ncbi:hypothetical protein B0A80_16900 [Flavobacterium tructae]|uniref:pPIWI-associating nuclease domain-containing protein n=1 Tax=Flavobacterium tructae TaxID=1114873 RepID=UPI000B5B6B24|nr:hypothetical protein [Flavobacterium tructae]OXB21474.1 hypothetical protein B0A80_16900 [Flavobacterium tructae]
MKNRSKDIEHLEALITNEFELELLHAAFQNLEYDNKLKFNNFAYSIRELSRHFLKSLSPDEEVTDCGWYKNEVGELGKIARSERIKFAIQGRLSDEVLNREVQDKERLRLLSKNILSSIDILNKYTHVNADTFGLDDSKIEAYVDQIISAFSDLILAIRESRQFLYDSLEEKLSKELFEETMWNVSGEIDILATHHTINGIFVTDYKIVEIGKQFLNIEVTGKVLVRLQWGSDGDLRRDTGHEMDTSFPFNADFTVIIGKNLKKSKAKLVNYLVNTDDWYANEDADDFSEELLGP